MNKKRKERTGHNQNLVIDLTGQVFGRLTVLNRAGYKSGKIAWLCRCSCGTEKIICGTSFKTGQTKSCGCIQKELMHSMRFVDLTGMVFHRLTVLKLVPTDNDRTMWLCRCICGNERVVDGGALKWGGTKSCGCFKADMRKRKGVDNPIWKGGRYVSRGGYVFLRRPDHPNAVNGYVQEHVLVMSEHIGRSLERKETVHHKNGVKTRNNIENLELWVSGHPPGQRVSDLIIWAKEILAKYEPIVEKL